MADNSHSLTVQTAAQKLQEILRFLLRFFKNPIQSMQHLPPWDIYQYLAFLFLVSIGSGFIGGLLSRSAASIIFGVVLLPVFIVFIALLSSLVLRKILIVVFQEKRAFNRVFAVVATSLIPILILRILSSLIPSITTLIGFSITSLLLIVGLTDNLVLPRPKVTKMVGIFFCLFLTYWIYNTIETSGRFKSVPSIPQETLDQLEKEFKASAEN